MQHGAREHPKAPDEGISAPPHPSLWSHLILGACWRLWGQGCADAVGTRWTPTSSDRELDHLLGVSQAACASARVWRWG